MELKLVDIVEMLSPRRKLVALLSVIGVIIGGSAALLAPVNYRFTSVIDFPVVSTLSSLDPTLQRELAADNQTLPRIFAAFRQAGQGAIFARARGELGLSRDAAETTVFMPQNAAFVTFSSLGQQADTDKIKAKHNWLIDAAPKDLSSLTERRQLLIERAQQIAIESKSQEMRRSSRLESDLKNAESEYQRVETQLGRRSDLAFANLTRLDEEAKLLATQMERLESDLSSSRTQRTQQRSIDGVTALLIENDIERRTANIERLRSRVFSTLPAERQDWRREIAEVERLRIESEKQSAIRVMQLRNDLAAAQQKVFDLERQLPVFDEERIRMKAVRIVTDFERAHEPEPRYTLVKGLLGGLLGFLIAATLALAQARRGTASTKR